MENQFLLFEEKPFTIVLGTDEAGRGPLAGPVCAACTVLPSDFPFECLDDSKKLSEKKRLYAENIIKEKAVAWAIAWATPQEIDKINILNASLMAMKRATEQVCTILESKGLKPEILLADGNKKPDVNLPCKAVVKGDATVHEIMAASILAKTARDRFMDAADKRWPEYGFSKHKGYPTKEHLDALEKIGPCPIHRLTFSPLSLMH